MPTGWGSANGIELAPDRAPSPRPPLPLAGAVAGEGERFLPWAWLFSVSLSLVVEMKREPRLRTSRQIQQAARALRRPMTPAEEVLWAALRRNQLAGLHFRRQHAIGRFVLDFYCSSRKLCVELDGPIHDEQQERDEARTAALAHQGIRVIRFRNEEVFSNLASVLRRIELAAESDETA
jgi:very-short-patch-repair endonuclease